MTEATKAGQKPTHELFAAQEGAQGKGFWRKIGAAWPNKDGQGYALKFDLFPVNGQTIQLHVVKPKTKQAYPPQLPSAFPVLPASATGRDEARVEARTTVTIRKTKSSQKRGLRLFGISVAWF